MFKHILVAVDGSDTANFALKEALNLAKECGSELRIAYVVDVYGVHPEVEFISIDEMVSALKKEGKKVLKHATQIAADASVVSQVSFLETTEIAPRIAEALANEADAWPADVIVVGTHGRRGFKHFVLGSVAESIVRVATKPVLLFRPV